MGFLEKGLIKKVFLILLLVQIFQINFASALTVQPSQQKIFITIEQGASYTFPLVIQNIEETVNITSYGQIANWITFGDNESYVLYPSLITTLSITISVPDNIKIGKYEVGIKANGQVLSEITVEVTLPLTEIKILQELSKVSTEIEKLKGEIQNITDKIREELNSTKENLTAEISAIMEYQKNITQVEQEKVELGEKVAELESKSESLKEANKRLNELTGRMITAQSSATFILGLLIGVVAILLILREQILEKFKKHAKIPKLKAKKYEYKPK